MVVQTGDNVLIGGFIVYGTGQKKIAVRAMGPSLPVAGKLSDPMVELHDATGAIVASNDNWKTTQQGPLITADQVAAIQASGLAPTNDLESALIVTINPGAYTVVVQGVNNATGVGLMEIYDLDPDGSPARLANISTRGNVLTGDNVMIGGFIVRGDVPKRTIVRARGPSLFLSGVPIAGRLMDPALELRDANGALIKANDNWRSDQQAEIAASSIAPTDDNEPAIVWTLTPGNYTTIVSGVNNTTGIALVEMYDLDQPPSADGSTLYITEMRPQGAATSQGSGTATLRLAADGKSAVIAFTLFESHRPDHRHARPRRGRQHLVRYRLGDTATGWHPDLGFCSGRQLHRRGYPEPDQSRPDLRERSHGAVSGRRNQRASSICPPARKALRCRRRRPPCRLAPRPQRLPDVSFPKPPSARRTR